MSEDAGSIQDTVYGLAFSPNFAADKLCFAARESGLYRSDDSGETWEDAYAAMGFTSALSTLVVAFSPDFEHDHQVFAGVQGAVMRSSDGGRTWYAALLPDPPPMVVSLAISPNYAYDGGLLAGTLEDGVLCSTDRGVQWSTWNFGLLDLNTYDLAISPNFEKDETLFVATESGIFRSTNGGRAWRGVEFPMEYAPVISLAISPNFPRDGEIYAGTEANGLFHSANAGKTWNPLGKKSFTGAINKLLLSADFAKKPQILALHEATLLLSNNGGTAWAHWQTGLGEDETITCMAAPWSLDKGAPLLVGLSDGKLVVVKRAK